MKLATALLCQQVQATQGLGLWVLVEVHGPAIATIEVVALRARLLVLGPRAIAENLVSIAPNVTQTFFENVTLNERLPELRTSADAAITQNAGD